MRLTRRELLAAAAVLAGCGSAEMTSPLPPSTSGRVDVAVVGAGLAGIAAAQVVRQSGRSVVVLEARAQMGGRTSSDNTTFAPLAVERGAQFFHQASVNPLLPMARAAGYPTYELGVPLLLKAGVAATSLEQAAFLLAAGAVQSSANAAGLAASQGQLDVSQAQAIAPALDLPYAELAASLLLLAETADLDLVSALDVYRAGQKGEGDVMTSGMGNFVAGLAQGLPISLNTPVTRVRYGATGVQLETPGGTIEAGRAILTLPLGVLRSGAVTFDPPLPASHQEAIESLPMGILNKIILQFDQDVFGTPDNALVLPNVDLTVPTNSVTRMYGANLSLTFVAAELAEELERQGDQACVDYALTQLEDLYGGNLRSRYSGRSLVTRWRADPFSRGSYTYAQPGLSDARAALAVPVNERLFFAGDGVSVASHSTILGAYETGQAAARAAVAQINL